MSRHPAPKLAFGPLLRAAGASDHAHAAVILDVSYRTIERFAREGVPCNTADVLAIKCGLHPLNVWSDAWDTAESEWESYKQRVAVDKRARKAAYDREWKRRRRAEREAWREMDRRWWQWDQQQDRNGCERMEREVVEEAA